MDFYESSSDEEAFMHGLKLVNTATSDQTSTPHCPEKRKSNPDEGNLHLV